MVPPWCAPDDTFTTRDGCAGREPVEQQVGEQEIGEMIDRELHLQAVHR